MADQLAKSAAMLDPIPQDDEATRISYTVVKAAAQYVSTEITTNLMNELESNLSSSNHLIGYMRDLIETIPKSAITLRSDKGIQRCVNFLSNRGNLKVFLYRRTPPLATDSLCRFCEMEDEDNSHILCHCPVLVNSRAEASQSNYLHPSITSIINLAALDKFLESCGVMESPYSKQD